MRTGLVSGAFALGLVFTLATERWGLAPWLRSALTIGFLGAYTTFSTLSFETYRLAEDRALGLAAANMLGGEKAYSVIPYFYSDQFDLSMEYAGHVTEWDRVIFRGDPATRSFLAFWLRGDIVVAGMNANVDGIHPLIGRLVATRLPIDVARLSDPAVPLEDLLPPV